jgi:O-antigen ligase
MHLAAQPNRLAMHPHQAYLQLLAEWGIVYTAALLVALSAWLWRGVRAWRRDPAADDARTALLLAVLASLVDAAFSGNAVMPMSQLWIALAWGAWAGTSAVAVAGAPLRPARALLVLLAAGELAAAVPAVTQWRHLESVLQQSLTDRTGAKMQPRFWSHGRLTADH